MHHTSESSFAWYDASKQFGVGAITGVLKKSNLHYTRDNTSKRVTSGVIHFRVLAPGHLDNNSDGRVVRVYASEAVDTGLIPSRVKPMTSKSVVTATLLDAQR